METFMGVTGYLNQIDQVTEKHFWIPFLHWIIGAYWLGTERKWFHGPVQRRRGHDVISLSLTFQIWIQLVHDNGKKEKQWNLLRFIIEGKEQVQRFVCMQKDISEAKWASQLKSRQDSAATGWKHAWWYPRWDRTEDRKNTCAVTGVKLVMGNNKNTWKVSTNVASWTEYL